MGLPPTVLPVTRNCMEKHWPAVVLIGTYRSWTRVGVMAESAILYVSPPGVRTRTYPVRALEW